MKLYRNITSVILCVMILFSSVAVSIYTSAAVFTPIHEWKFDTYTNHPTLGAMASDTAGSSSVRIFNSVNGDIIADSHFGGAYNPALENHYAMANYYTMDMSKSYTVSMWFKSEHTDTYSILLEGVSSDSQKEFSISVNNAKRIYLEYNTGFGMQIGNSDIDDGKWQHLSITYDQTNYTVYGYINGTLETSALVPAGQRFTSALSGNRILFGNHIDYLHPLVGGLANVRFYSAIMGTEEIIEQYEAETPYSVMPSPLYEWKCIDPQNGDTYLPGTGINTGGMNVNSTENWASDDGKFPTYFSPTEMSPYGYAPCDALDMSKSFTLSTWFKVSKKGGPDDQFDVLMCNKIGESEHTWDIQINSVHKPYFQIWQPSTEVEDFNMQLEKDVRDGMWHHLAFSYSQSTGEMTGFIDGLSYGSKTLSSAAKTRMAKKEAADPLIVLGNRTNQAAMMNGGLSHIRLYNKALTLDNIAALVENDGGVPVNENPTHEWLYNESGVTVPDTGVLQNHGTIANHTVDYDRIEVSPFGTVYSPIASNAYVGAGEYSLNMTQPFSVSSWYLCNTEGYDQVVITDAPHSADGSTPPNWQVRINANGKMFFQWGTEKTYGLELQEKAKLNQWTLIAFTFDGTTLKGYINAQEVAEMVIPPAKKVQAANMNQRLMMGNSLMQNAAFRGQLAHIRIHSVALSTAKMQSYIDGIGGIPAPVSGDLTHQWIFNEPTGIVATDTGVARKNAELRNFNGNDFDRYPDDAFGSVYSPVAANAFGYLEGYTMNMTLPFSVSAWVLTENMGANQVIITDAPNSADGSVPANWQMRINTQGKFFFQWGTDKTYGLETPEIITVNAWTHIAFTFDSTNLTAYVNAEKVATMVIPDAKKVQAGNMCERIMIANCLLQNEGLNGLLSCVRIHSVAIEKDVIEGYIDSIGGIPPARDKIPLKLQHVWRFDDTWLNPETGKIVIFDRRGSANGNICHNSDLVPDDVFGAAFAPDTQVEQDTFVNRGGLNDGYTLDLSYEFAISAWFNVKQQKNVQYLIGDAPYTDMPTWAIGINKKGKLFFQFGVDPDFGMVLENTTIYEKWTNVTFIFDGEYMRGYIDGVESGVMRIPGYKARQVSSHDRIMMGGNRDKQGTVNGRITNLRIYTGMLENQDLIDMLASDGGIHPGKKAYVPYPDEAEPEAPEDSDVGGEDDDKLPGNADTGEKIPVYILITLSIMAGFVLTVLRSRNINNQ